MARNSSSIFSDGSIRTIWARQDRLQIGEIGRIWRGARVVILASARLAGFFKAPGRDELQISANGRKVLLACGDVARLSCNYLVLDATSHGKFGARFER